MINKSKHRVYYVFSILAIVILTLGISTGHVFASGFNDDAQIGMAYSEAVATMTEKGVLAGFPDGSFRPQGTLTREQAAKIVAYILLGSEKADGLSCSTKPFIDVEVTRWSAPYIAWCCDRGILNGYGNGLFGPSDELTGVQFAKMLLCAFFGDAGGRYTGAGWADSVEEDGYQHGLFTGDFNMCSNLPLQRQQAALMVYNAEHEETNVDALGADQSHDEQGQTVDTNEQDLNMSVDEQILSPSTEEQDYDLAPQPQEIPSDGSLDPFEGDEV